MANIENIYLDITDDSAFGHMRNVSSGLAHIALANRVLNGGEMPQSNEAVSLIASSAHTINEVTAQQVNIAAGGLTLFLNVTVNGSAESLTLNLEGKDSVSGVWVQLDTSGVLTSGTGLFAWQPSVGLPRYWRAGVNKSGGASVTYSLGGQYCRDHPSDATLTGSLPAGTNNIGDVDVLSIAAGDNNIGNVDIVTLPALVAGTANIGDVDVLTLPAGTVAGGSSLPAGTNNIGDVDVLTLPGVAGDVAHSTADTGNPLKVGAKAIAFGANPTEVDADERTNLYAQRNGIPWVIGGHPNVVSIRNATAAAQTDVALVTVGAGVKIVVTQVMVTTSKATTVNVDVLIGFGAATTPTTTGVVAAQTGIEPGAGFTRGDGSGILGVGAANEDLRITATAATTGMRDVVVSYYTIAEA